MCFTIDKKQKNCFSKNCTNGINSSKASQMGKSIQEWTKQNLWKTAFKKFEGVWSALNRQILPGPFLNTLTHLLFKVVC